MDFLMDFLIDFLVDLPSSILYNGSSSCKKDDLAPLRSRPLRPPCGWTGSPPGRAWGFNLSRHMKGEI